MVARQTQSVIEALQKQTAKAQRQAVVQAKAALKQAEREDRALQKKMRKRAKEVFQECLIEAKRAAGKGETSATVALRNHDSAQSPPWCNYLERFTRKLLEKEGFTVKREDYTVEPHGSDPMFPYTVYSTYITISWE